VFGPTKRHSSGSFLAPRELGPTRAQSWAQDGLGQEFAFPQRLIGTRIEGVLNRTRWHTE
jgi:hypothetical protein